MLGGDVTFSNPALKSALYVVRSFFEQKRRVGEINLDLQLFRPMISKFVLAIFFCLQNGIGFLRFIFTRIRLFEYI